MDGLRCFKKSPAFLELICLSDRCALWSLYSLFGLIVVKEMGSEVIHKPCGHGRARGAAGSG